MGNPVFITGDIARQVFDWRDAVAALQAVYAQPFGPGACPPRIVAQQGPSWLRALPSNPPGCRYFGAKLMGAAMNVAQPSVDYVIVLFDRETSRIAGFLDANLVTAYRTAATSASAFDKLAPHKPLRLGVIGSGLEASMHTRAFSAMRDLEEVAVYSTTPARREAFAQKLSDELGLPVRPAATPQEAVGDADIVLTAARSHDETPILFADWLPEKAMVVSIGSTIPQQREIDASVIARADLIVCDMLEEVLHETGDMLAAVANGIDVSSRAISLNDLMNGSASDRVAAAQRPMFKSVGGGVQDVVVGGAILDRAIAAGLAAPLPFQFEGKAL
ncbi:ornithine cyclodeaminase family protein [Novosphingobium sp.]|uniref:ornithine cyclodeaminase family protein n=1 Tax=Novosphingobium sp. TaxID=1874826 RepID=UPI003564B791